MSGSYDEATPSMEEITDSFWEVGNYKRTVKRIDDGHRLCNDLMSCLMSERRSRRPMPSSSQIGPNVGVSSWRKVSPCSSPHCPIPKLASNGASQEASQPHSQARGGTQAGLSSLKRQMRPVRSSWRIVVPLAIGSCCLRRKGGIVERSLLQGTC
uniref:Uncharacterized protein n=1 Tax=Monodelphis domestica TaxID=13616 RepID=A0A5F8GES4_MONDO